MPEQFEPYVYTPVVKVLGVNVGGSPLQTPAEYLLAFTDYLHKNAWSIVFLIAGGYLLKSKVIDPYLAQYQRAKSHREATDPSRVSVLEADMRRIRAAQQEEAQRKAAEAAELVRKKKMEEMEKKRVKQPMEEKGGSGRRLDGRRLDEATSTARSGYNPMDPWSSNTSGYRATRRTVNTRRGG